MLLMRRRQFPFSWIHGCSVVVLVLAQASSSLALPNPGAKATQAQIADLDGRVLQLDWPHDKPVLILYEGKSAEMQNMPFKNELERLANEETNSRKAIHFVAVADVSKYDYWPVRGIAERIIRQKAAATGSTIYCDWDGRFRQAFGLEPHKSSVLLIGTDGRVQFSAAGPMNAQVREKLIGMLRAEAS